MDDIIIEVNGRQLVDLKARQQLRREYGYQKISDPYISGIDDLLYLQYQLDQNLASPSCVVRFVMKLVVQALRDSIDSIEAEREEGS
jgi:hypothetical protein